MKKWILFFLIYIVVAQSINAQQLFTEQTLKFSRVMAFVEAFYVDSTNQEFLIEKAITEVLKNLDPHSTYINSEDVKEMNEGLEGNFEGIGIQFNLLFDSIIVIAPIPGGPSEKAGIHAGDRIVMIENENVAGVGITTNGVRKRLLGDKGTRVNIGIYRRGIKEILDYTIVRDKIPVHSLDAAYMVADNIGFVKLNRFSATSEKEFYEAIGKLQGKNMEHLIIDLRGNTGGYLEAAIRLTDQFFESEKLIVYLEGLKTPRRDFKSRKGGVLTDARIVVLVDEGSASASEILSGALQDWDRGVIMGRRTFGKGLVQNGFNLNDGSMIRLTIARYYTPTGRLIQRPYDNGIEKYMTDFYSRYTNGEMLTADSISFPDSLKYATIINGRTVYGGGGIMPDIFVPADTTWYSDYYRDLIRKNVIVEYTLDYIDNNRKKLGNRYPDFESFNSEFSFTPGEIADFIDNGKSLGVEYNDAQFCVSKKQLLLILKGLIARDLWEMSEYYQVIYRNDILVKEAVDLISSPSKYYSTLGIEQYQDK